MLKEATRSIAVRLARKIAGGPHKLAFDLYDRYKVQHPGTEQHTGKFTSQKLAHLEENIKAEIRQALLNEEIRKLLVGEFPSRLNTRVDRAQRTEIAKRHAEIIAAFAHYALFAQWVEQVAQDSRIELTEDETMLLFGMQNIAARAFGVQPSS